MKDVADEHAKKLARTVHAFAVQTATLRHENERLRAAFINEKKRRQRGKPLLLERPAEDNGGAYFYSPSKVQLACNKQEAVEL